MQTAKAQEPGKTRHVLSLTVFAIAVAVLLLGGVFGHNWMIGILLGLAFVCGGFIFYRRGK